MEDRGTACVEDGTRHGYFDDVWTNGFRYRDGRQSFSLIVYGCRRRRTPGDGLSSVAASVFVVFRLDLCACRLPAPLRIPETARKQYARKYTELYGPDTVHTDGIQTTVISVQPSRAWTVFLFFCSCSRPPQRARIRARPEPATGRRVPRAPVDGVCRFFTSPCRLFRVPFAQPNVVLYHRVLPSPPSFHRHPNAVSPPPPPELFL